jgi:O-antigen/teichoic acid export membrane protein
MPALEPAKHHAGDEVLATAPQLGETGRAALRLSLQMSVARLLGAGLSVVARIVGAGALGPANFGLLRLADVVQQYSGYVELGARHAVARQVSILVGRGEEQEARLVASLLLTWMVIAAGLVCLVLWLLFSAGVTLDGLLTIGNLLLLSGLIILNRLNAFLANYVRAYGNFDALGMQSYILSIAPPLLSVPAILLWGVTGGLAAQLLVAVLVGGNLTFFGARLGLFRLRPRLPIRRAIGLLRVSLLLHFNSLSETLFETLELTLLAIFASTHQLGLYGFAVGWMSSAILILAGVNLVTERAMLVEHARRGVQSSIQAFRRYLETPLIVYLLVASAMLGITYFALDAAVALFLPEFGQAMIIARVLLFGQMMYSATNLPRMYFNATDQLASRLGLALFGIAVNVALDLLFLELGYGAIGVAIGAAISYCLYACLLLVSCSGQLYGRWRPGAELFLRLAVASGGLALVLSALSLWQPVFTHADQGLFLRLVLEGLEAAMKMLAYAGVALLLYLTLFQASQPQRELKRIVAFMRDAVKNKFAVLGLRRM